MVDDRAEDALDPRRTAHEILGQTHALFTILLDRSVVHVWCPPDLAEEHLACLPVLAEVIGRAQTAVASGHLDRDLVAHGLGGQLSRPKRRLLATALERLQDARRTGSWKRFRSWARTAAGAAETVGGSLSAVVPGVGVVAEAAGLVVAAVDARTARSRRNPGPPDATRS